MDDTIYKIALAGLLHDIGKFAQRAEVEKETSRVKENFAEFCPQDKATGNYSHLHAAHTAYFIETFIPENLCEKTELFNAARHHKNPPDDLYREADRISAGMERYVDEAEAGNYKDVKLLSIFDSVELQYTIRDKDGNINNRWHYNFTPLKEDFYPVFSEQKHQTDGSLQYKTLWNSFIREINELRNCTNLISYFNELYWLLEKYTWCIPSATNVFPDIPLFDHLKTTAAIASCFHLLRQEQTTDAADFILYAGDISGIQNYIFKISESQGIGGISKRLRGRSFFISMLTEVLSRHIVNSLNLTVTNINYCGGGNFEILLPNTATVKKYIADFRREIDAWLLRQFNGFLGYVDATQEMSKDDLRDRYGTMKDALADVLQEAKLHKSSTHFDEDSLWIDNTGIDGRITICPSCNLTVTQREHSICEMCQQDKDVGAFLPQAGYLVFSQEHIQNSAECKVLSFGQFGTAALLKKNTQSMAAFHRCTSIYSLIDRDLPIKARYFLAQTLPVAQETMELETEKDESGDIQVFPGQTLSFTSLADMAQGDKRIGMLKMDVDNLALIFSLGLDNPQSHAATGQNLRSISRLSTLSRKLTCFFTTHIDRLCETVFQNWLRDENNQWPGKDKISSIFYLVFSGGDDLVIVGPWDRIIELAREIRKSFKNFTCHNPNITVSAGIYICKPKFPISVAIDKAEEALKQSKDKGRNRITVMGETAVWDCEDQNSRVYQKALQNKYPGTRFEDNEIRRETIYLVDDPQETKERTLTFEELTSFAFRLQQFYDAKQISRQFIYRLLKAKEEFFVRQFNDDRNHYEEEQSVLFLPHLLYSIERNADKTIKSTLKETLITAGNAKEYVRQAYVPCKYVLMKTKK